MCNFREICEMIHENGGQVYLDGANMNAQVSLKMIVGAPVLITVTLSGVTPLGEFLPVRLDLLVEGLQYRQF